MQLLLWGGFMDLDAAAMPFLDWDFAGRTCHGKYLAGLGFYLQGQFPQIKFSLHSMISLFLLTWC